MKMLKKEIFISQQTYPYIPVTDILKFYEVLFFTYCKGLFCFYAYILPYMHKTLPTLGNEKEQ